MSISSQLLILNQTKGNIKQAINLKGVSVTNEAFAAYPDKVRLIPSGTGTYESQIILYLERRLKHVDIPYGTTTLGRDTFRESMVHSVNIPSTVTSIGQEAFADSQLEGITIPSSVTSIGYRAFYRCYLLETLNLPNTAITLGDEVFSGCKKLTSVTIPDSITTIPDRTFYMEEYIIDSLLETVVLGNGVTSIGDRAFGGCRALQSFTINTITPPTFGNQVFVSTNQTFTIYVPDESVLAYQIADGWSSYSSRIKGISEKP
jgi:hypothetical protein